MVATIEVLQGKASFGCAGDFFIFFSIFKKGAFNKGYNTILSNLF